MRCVRGVKTMRLDGEIIIVKDCYRPHKRQRSQRIEGGYAQTPLDLDFLATVQLHDFSYVPFLDISHIQDIKLIWI